MTPTLRPLIARLEPYEWEVMASDVAAAAGIPESAVVHFDTNTTPWPPVAWEETVLDMPRLPVNEYPHASNEPLRSALAAHVGVAPDEIVVTSGADEALALIAQVFLEPGRAAVLIDPTFSMFRVVSEGTGATIRRVAVDDGWDVPRAALLDAVRQPDVAVVWLCSPNNPTGRLVPPTLVHEVLGAAPRAAVVVDEAYYEISGQTVVDEVRGAGNAVVVRTFSKGYGLAGARVGYLVAPRPITTAIEAVRLPQNMTTFSLAAAARALADQDGLAARVADLIGERQRLASALRALRFEIVPSAANFLLVRPPSPAPAVAAWLQGGGFIVRSYAGHPRLDDWLRLAVRSPDEDDRLLRRLAEFR
jgi:histidinol-phosphate aminotransferase